MHQVILGDGIDISSLSYLHIHPTISGLKFGFLMGLPIGRDFSGLVVTSIISLLQLCLPL